MQKFNPTEASWQVNCKLRELFQNVLPTKYQRMTSHIAFSSLQSINVKSHQPYEDRCLVDQARKRNVTL